MIKLNERAIELVDIAEKECKTDFDNITSIEFKNQLKVLNAFNDAHIQSRHFIGSSGYGHNDIGKEKICELFATIFHREREGLLNRRPY